MESGHSSGARAIRLEPKKHLRKVMEVGNLRARKRLWKKAHQSSRNCGSLLTRAALRPNM
jgi:hypothetical protein